MKKKSKKYILSIGINDYRNCIGGTNKVILEHQKLFLENNISYVFISPIKQCVESKKLWNVIENNYLIGVKCTKNLLLYLKKKQSKNEVLMEIHIHNISRVSLIDLDYIMQKLDLNIKFYIHDFYTICTRELLLRDDNSFCGCEEMSEKKCLNCSAYKGGIQKINKIKKLINKYKDKILFIFPSENAKSNWLKAYTNYSENTLIISHQLMRGDYTGNKRLIAKDVKIKIAFIGEKLTHKGWGVWEENVLKENMKNNKYELYYLGNVKNTTSFQKKVDFRKDINAMTKKLRQLEIDCVILWSVLPETYSYTYYESFSANSFVITNTLSGNIEKQVVVNKNGVVLQSEDELKNLLQSSEDLRKIINEYKSGKVCGPKELVANNEILNYLSTREKSVLMLNDIEKTWNIDEILLTILYKTKEVFYYVRKKVI